jgi:hypothetical protein
MVPLLVGAETVLGTRRELGANVQAEKLVEVKGVIETAQYLLLHLFGRAVDVGVVLHEVTNPEKTVQGAGKLVAMQVAGLGQPQGQLAVAMRRLAVENAVARAIHRLETEVAALDVESEHVLAELVPVPRGPP